MEEEKHVGEKRKEKKRLELTCLFALINYYLTLPTMTVVKYKENINIYYLVSQQTRL